MLIYVGRRIISYSQAQHPCAHETVALIHKVFGKNTRGSGMSWEESNLHDEYVYDKAANAAARARDPVDKWQELVEQGAVWEPIEGYGGFAFLDPAGARFYLPAVMILQLQNRWDVTFFLTSEHSQETWSTLSDAERGCVAAFLRCLMDSDTTGFEKEDLEAGYRQFWREYDANPLPNEPG